MAQYKLKEIITKKVTFKDFLSIFILAVVYPFAIIAKIFIRGMWLVCEDKTEARDNGYWLFKWIRENEPKQKVIYAIDKKSADYDKVKGLGKVINYGGITHWFWYIVADRNISSQKDGKPNAAVCYFFEVVLKLRKNNRIFLQHGVTKDDADWLYYENTFMKRFVVATKEENEFILSKFHYPKENVQLTGFPRFDQLNNDKLDESIILIMPTWREWLRDEANVDGFDFCNTEYFKQWNSLLNSDRFIEMLKKYNKKALFYPHRNMRPFLDKFSSGDKRIEIVDWTKLDIQDALKLSAYMITDFSSVFFDFAYMQKPILFYQFDELEFRQRQYKEGYFNYHTTALGKWSDTENDLLKDIEDTISKEYAFLSEEKSKKIFAYLDMNNCKRVYQMIKEI